MKLSNYGCLKELKLDYNENYYFYGEENHRRFKLFLRHLEKYTNLLLFFDVLPGDSTRSAGISDEDIPIAGINHYLFKLKPYKDTQLCYSTLYKFIVGLLEKKNTIILGKAYAVITGMSAKKPGDDIPYKDISCVECDDAEKDMEHWKKEIKELWDGYVKGDEIFFH